MPTRGYHRNAEIIEHPQKNNEIHIAKSYLSGCGFLKNNEKTNGFSIFFKPKIVKKIKMIKKIKKIKSHDHPLLRFPRGPPSPQWKDPFSFCILKFDGCFKCSVDSSSGALEKNRRSCMCACGPLFLIKKGGPHSRNLCFLIFEKNSYKTCIFI